MDMNLYKFQDRMTSMNPAQFLETILRIEGGMRTGEFSYSPPTVYQQQVEQIKATWPEELKAALRKRASELANGQPMSHQFLRRAMIDLLLEVVAPTRSKANSSPVERENESAMSDFCLSMLFRVPPDISPIGGPRKFGQTTLSVRTCWGWNADKLIVKCAEADKADVFLLALHNSAAKKSWLVGWIERQGLVLAKRGNKITNPDECMWPTMSYYVPLASLRPMADFLRVQGIKELQEGLLFEIVPRLYDLPILQRAKLEEFINQAEDNVDDFYRVLGLKPEPKGEPKPVIPPPSKMEF